MEAAIVIANCLKNMPEMPEMNAVGAGVDRDPPVIVDDKLGASLAAYSERLARLAENFGVGALLDP